MSAYYNEVDPNAAQWLRNLIKAGHIADGEVDERSIEDVRPDELAGFTQCHFFAGIGVWSHALRRAGWRDDRKVWTGSCPCQPFSAAGKGAGTTDERHLWPAWFHLIEQCRPDVVFGEQVEAAIKHGWLDLVQADLEGSGYAVAPVCLPAAGIGAPHIRSRLWFVADTQGERANRESGIVNSKIERSGANDMHELGRTGEVFSGLADNTGERCGEARAIGGRPEERLADGSAVDGMANSTMYGLIATERPGDIRRVEQQQGRADGQNECIESEAKCSAESWELERASTGPTNGHWRDADWLFCRDGKWRPVESGTFPLVNGVAARVGRVRADQERIAEIPPRKDQGSRSGRLKGYGNAIVAPVAEEVIRAYLKVRP